MRHNIFRDGSHIHIKILDKYSRCNEAKEDTRCNKAKIDIRCNEAKIDIRCNEAILTNQI